MKITKAQLKQIIKEELDAALGEARRVNLPEGAVEKALTMAIAERGPRIGLPAGALIKVVMKKLEDKLGVAPDVKQVEQQLRPLLTDGPTMERLGIEKVDLGAKVTRTPDGIAYRLKDQ